MQIMGADDNRGMTAAPPSPPRLDGIATLADWGVLRARGADAASFLHGQLTSDTVSLGDTQARLAAFCSAKGRMQASFIVWRRSPEELLLATHASVLPAVLKRLSMFVLRAKCKLDDASAEIRLFGLAGSAASHVRELSPWTVRRDDSGECIRLPDADGVPRALLAATASSAAPAGHPPLPLAHWRWLEIASGIATIEAATVDQFVPQMLNLELVGGVDFQKGCYPGQEVVARSQYRGTLKRRLFRFDSDAPAQAGQEIFHSADPGQPAGMVANAAPRPDGSGSSLLAELKIAALDGGSLHLGAPDGPALVRRELPYPLPIDQAAPV
jgi:folate-binding protein YgfZ